jgi:hypothetical protein
VSVFFILFPFPVVEEYGKGLMADGILFGNRRFSTEPVVFANGTNGTAIVVQPTSNATILAGPVRAANLLVYVIDQVLTLPQTLSQTAGDLFGSLAGLLGQANLVEPLE